MSVMKEKTMDMCSGPLLGKMITYTTPIALSGILQLLFNAADLAVVGQFCGSVSVAAVGATGSLINLIVALFMSLSVGAGVLVAQALGAQKSGNDSEEKLSRTVHTAITASLIGGALLTVLGILASRPILEIMETPDDVIKLSAVYMKIYFCGSIPSLVYNFGSAILRALGDTKRPLYFLALSGCVNVVLNIVFVLCFDMDVAGVALATAVSQALSAVLVVLTLMHRTDACRLVISKLRIHKATMLKMFRIGIPAGIQSSIFSISNVLIQSSINSFGSVVMSGNAAAGNIEGFAYILMNSFYQTALNFTAQNYGAGKYERIKRIAGTSFACVTVVGITASIILYTFARPLLSIYITDSESAIEYGVLRMSVVCLTYFLCGAMEVATGIIRGMGTSVMPMIVSILGVCGIRITWIFTVFNIPRFHTLRSLYISYPISWIVTVAVHCIVLSVLLKWQRDPKTRNRHLP